MARKSTKRGNGTGSIVTLGGNRKKPFAVRVTVGWTEDGKQKFKYLSYHAKISEARKSLREYLVNPFDLEHKDITLKAVYEKLMETNPVAESTTNNYHTAFRKCAEIQNVPIRNIKAGHIEEILERHTPSAQKNVKNMLNRVYKYALKYDYVTKNVAELVETDSIQSKQRQPFTNEQIEKILAYDRHPLAYTIKLLLYTGLRISELLNIETQNVHLEDGYMIGGTKTEAGRDRTIPIHEDVKSIIEALYNPNNKYLIVDNRGHKISYRNYLLGFWNTIKKDIGFEHTPHCTRHTFITHILKCGADRELVQRIVGHKGDITDRYNHADIEQLKLHMQKLTYN